MKNNVSLQLEKNVCNRLCYRM